MTDEDIEALAIRAAKGNNGGEWLKRPDGTEHYTEAQKDYWRQFVRDLGSVFYKKGLIDGTNMSLESVERVLGQLASGAQRT